MNPFSNISISRFAFSFPFYCCWFFAVFFCSLFISIVSGERNVQHFNFHANDFKYQAFALLQRKRYISVALLCLKIAVLHEKNARSKEREKTKRLKPIETYKCVHDVCIEFENNISMGEHCHSSIAKQQIHSAYTHTTEIRYLNEQFICLLFNVKLLRSRKNCFFSHFMSFYFIFAQLILRKTHEMVSYISIVFNCINAYFNLTLFFPCRFILFSLWFCLHLYLIQFSRVFFALVSYIFLHFVLKPKCRLVVFNYANTWLYGTCMFLKVFIYEQKKLCGLNKDDGKTKWQQHNQTTTWRIYVIAVLFVFLILLCMFSSLVTTLSFFHFSCFYSVLLRFIVFFLFLGLEQA